MQTWKFNFCIKRIKNGDTKWLANIYNEYYGTMILTAWSVVRNVEDAEDIASNFLKHILQNANNIGYIEYPDAWISSAIHKKAMDYVRKNSRIDYIDDLDNDRFAHTINYDFYCALRTGFKNLTEYEQQLAVLRFFNDLRYSEIALNLGKPIGTIKSDISKIKRKLEHIKKYI